MSSADGEKSRPELQVDAHTNALGFWSAVLALAEEDGKRGAEQKLQP